MYIDAHRLDDSLFLDPYVELMTDRLDCPPQFHPLVATVAVSSCLNRELGVFFDQSDFFPNVLGLIVSESGTRKSTAMRPLVSMANLRILPEEVYLMPYDVTPERFVDILAEHPQALFLNDEFGHFLSRSSSRRQSYMTGFLQMMTHITDCPLHYSRSLVGREVVVEKPYLTALLGLTPEVLLGTSSLLDVLQGFLPRFLIVTGSIEDMPNRPLRPLRGITSHRTDILRQALARIYKRYQGFSYATGGCNEAPISKDALSTLNAYRKRADRRIRREPPEMRPFHQRWAYHILKLAIVRMADHLGGGISDEDMKWATEQYELYVKEARKIIEKYILAEVRGRDTVRVERVKQYIQECGEVTRRELARHFNLRIDELGRILTTLEEAGVIETFQGPPPSERGGRPSYVIKYTGGEEG